ncbi:hypothetical protein [Arenimonas daejeonensis]|uniref:hypothetical protein n=1 Tax=Arenimonas daejeonensis TaxID=370777 RepID=UPI001D13E9A6|nr:hypothetical protein [Arenimonas daejeonensis]
MAITIRPVSPADHDQWEVLYSGYADFYKVHQTPEMRATVWSWLNDNSHELEGFVAVNEAGGIVGIAHYRPFSRPLSATVGGLWTICSLARGARTASR